MKQDYSFITFNETPAHFNR